MPRRCQPIDAKPKSMPFAFSLPCLTKDYLVNQARTKPANARSQTPYSWLPTAALLLEAAAAELDADTGLEPVTDEDTALDDADPDPDEEAEEPTPTDEPEGVTLAEDPDVADAPTAAVVLAPTLASFSCPAVTVTGI